MKQIFNEAMKGLFRQATTYETNDVLTCCHIVVHQYCRMELLVQTGISPMKQIFESSIKQRITYISHPIFI
jgi:hypothetical protein